MARRVTSSRFAGRSSPRRQTEWIAGTVNFTDSTAGAIVELISFSQVALASLVPFTIVRTVGLVTIAADLNFITNQIYSGAVGMQVIGDDARAAGVATYASPFADAGDDSWLYHQFFAATIDDRSDSDLVLSQSWVIDSKAQRKVVDGQAIVFSSEGGSEADGFDVAVGLRILCKLH